MDINAIGLRNQDRAILIGATGTGKSTLAKFLIKNWYDKYINNIPIKRRGRILIIDTKPRWRGPIDVRGKEMDYGNWSGGDFLENAKVLNRARDFKDAWDKSSSKTYGNIIIAQNLELRTSKPNLVSWQSLLMEEYFGMLDTHKPSLLYIDEGMDFFTERGYNRGSDIIQTFYRAGRELGGTALIAVQRPKTINIQTLTESNVMYLFQIRFTEDMKRLREMGVPMSVRPPKQKKKFIFFRDEIVYPNELMLSPSMI